MRFSILHDHQGKSQNFLSMLAQAGHTETPDLHEADVLFAHTDAPWQGNDPEVIETFGGLGKPVVLYPHSGPPSVEYDGLQPVSPHVRAKLVFAPGHTEVLKRYEYPVRTYEIGWYYCPLLRFAPVKKVERVLFAPMHPWMDEKTILDVHQMLNQAVFRALKEDRPEGSEVYVRYFGGEDLNGLEQAEGFKYRKIEKLGNDHGDIDEADLVVSCGTLAYLAIARGKPTIMFGQESAGVSDMGDKRVDHWEAYGDYMRYPVDLHDWPLPMLVQKACEGGQWLEEWKRLFIGKQMTTQSLNRALNKIMGVKKQQRSKRKSRR